MPDGDPTIVRRGLKASKKVPQQLGKGKPAVGFDAEISCVDPVRSRSSRPLYESGFGRKAWPEGCQETVRTGAVAHLS